MSSLQWLLINLYYGIHTIELYLGNLKYSEVQKVIERLVDSGKIQKIKSDPYNIDRHMKSTYFVGDGIRHITSAMESVLLSIPAHSCPGSISQ